MMNDTVTQIAAVDSEKKNIVIEHNYQIDNRRFTIQSVFKDSGESFGTVLLRLMKEDISIKTDK